MQRRCITIHLDPRQEMPASRVFKEPGLLGKVMRRRGEFVADALTIVMAWMAEGSPMSTCQALVSYEAWGLWCRQPLLWLGKSDPAYSTFAAMAEDPERQLLRTLLVEWRGAFGTKAVMVRDLVDRALSDGDAEGNTLREVLIEISDQGESVNRKRLGRWIARHAGQVVGGLRIESARRTANAESWKVVAV